MFRFLGTAKQIVANNVQNSCSFCSNNRAMIVPRQFRIDMNTKVFDRATPQELKIIDFIIKLKSCVLVGNI